MIGKKIPWNARNNSWPSRHFLGREELSFAFGIFAQFPKMAFYHNAAVDLR
jgi:hypothetical protein